MTKPSDFILNSDYLSIAQSEKTEQTVNIGGGTVNTTATLSQDFVFRSSPGSISRFMIRANNNNFSVGNELITKIVWNSSNKVIGRIRVYRISDSLCRFSLDYQNYNTNPSTNPSTYPSMTYTVKIVSFKSPDEF